jgi:UDP-N-acetylglucosamine 1-carboxyvinyltransferase
MSEFIEISGGVPLRGSVRVGGAKNASLPLLLASLLSAERCTFSNVPNLEDINLTLRLLEHLGGEIEYSAGRAAVKMERLLATEASYSLVKALRASFWVLGPLLARGRAARVALPGGDIIGARPVDMHIAGLSQMGADIKVKHGVVFATAVNGLKPANVELRFPSVGATHQIVMAAALTPGTTVIRNAAREPEIVAVADFITSMGGDVEGAGSDVIVIRGKEELGGAHVDIIGDRIEAATYLLAGAATRGEVCAEGINPLFFGEFLEYLDALGLQVDIGTSWVRVKALRSLRPIQAVTGPFPRFATDIQAPLMAALCVADGTSTIEENIFEGRYGHVSELCRMGAEIQVSDRIATIRGVQKLTGAPVEAFDIRAAAALVIAALAAEGTTAIAEPQHLRRGYEELEMKLSALGATIGAKLSDPEDFMFTGC